MKLCAKCQQRVAEDVAVCPNCGTALPASRQRLDDYQLVEFVREGHGCLLYRARKEADPKDYLIRLFKPQTHLDDAKAERLHRELTELKKLPAEHFVQHFELKRSAKGEWYRVSEWNQATEWSDLFAAGMGRNPRHQLELLARIAEAIAELHQHGHLIPHLILPDLLVTETPEGLPGVKLDYKLSRFLDPEMAHPSSQLLALLRQHPDITGNRPLDARSDVWSLGRAFVAILACSPDVDDPRAHLDRLQLPSNLCTLFRCMLADDPDARPKSLALVAAALRQVNDAELAAAAQPSAAGLAVTVHTLQRRAVLLASAFLLLLASGVFLQLRFGLFSHDDAQILGRHARRLSSSVALVAVEFRFEVGTNVVLNGLSTGTAFLVDREGHLLSNRHVTCPWLESAEYWNGVLLARSSGLPTKFSHRMWLWFDGAEALKLARDEISAPSMEDVFAENTAYRSDGSPRVRVVGIVPPVWDRAVSREFPLGEDVAVLQVEPPPKLEPLPLAMNRTAPRQLDAVALLGFPRGVDTMPGRVIRVSTTLGHVRRTFANVLQSDVSTHPGNSGGPVLDLDGQVIGIATAISLGGGGLLGASPQSDLSLILPIERTTNLLAAVRNGKARWDGLPLPQVGLEAIAAIRLANQGKWLEARTAIDRLSSSAPEVVWATAVLHYCSGDEAGARRRLAELREISPESVQARFLQAVWNWLRDPASADVQLKALLPTEWASGDAELFGQLAAMLREPRPVVSNEPVGDNRTERTLFAWVQALRLERTSKSEMAEPALRAALRTANPEDSFTALTRLELERIQQAVTTRLTNATVRQRYQHECAQFWSELEATSAQRVRTEHAFLAMTLQYSEADSAEDKARLSRQMRATDSLNRGITLQIAFLHAQNGEWLEAIRELDGYLQPAGREGMDRRGVLLLRGQMLELAGRKAEARTAYQTLARNASAGWYCDLARLLAGEVRAETLRAKAASHPIGGLTLELALGLRAESEKHKGEAIEHYRNALETGYSQWMEYTLAKERLQALRGK